MTLETRSPSQPDGLPWAVRRVRAQVPLILLETLRDRDRPGEVLDDENVTLTMPRRFGLSNVVGAQIRHYQKEARRGRRVPEPQVHDLLRLVTRRPDAEDVFREVGRALTGDRARGGWLRACVPRRISFALARRAVARRLRVLFGGALVRSTGAPFQLEAVHHLLIRADPGGEACAVVTGLAEEILRGYLRRPVRIEHPECPARGDDRCLWVLSDEDDEGRDGREVLGGPSGEGET